MSEQREVKGFAALAHMGEQGDFSIIEAIGGIRGVVESMLPGLAFVILFLVSSDLRLTLIASASLAVVLVLVRLVQRQSTLGALGGLISVGICLIWAWRTGQARNYYTFGFVTNAVYLVLLGISLLVRVPAIGLMVEFILTLPMSDFGQWLRTWRDDDALRRAYSWATMVWMVVFALRLLVQVPLYIGNDVGWLGTMRLVMGIPCWALALWLSYLLIATPLHAHKQAEHDEREAVIDKDDMTEKADVTEKVEGTETIDATGVCQEDAPGHGVADE